MDRRVRPSGLTVFAIINFIYAGITGLTALSVFGSSVAGNLFSAAKPMDMVPEITPLSVVFMVMQLAMVVLLVLSGIGYLGQNRVVGRLIGTVYAVAQIAKTIAWLALETATRAQLSVVTIADFIWPCLTLIFINLVFHDVWRKRGPLTEQVGATERVGAAERAGSAEAGEAGKNPPHLILVMLQSVRQTLRGSQGIFFIGAALFVCLGLTQSCVSFIDGQRQAYESQGNLEPGSGKTVMKEAIRKLAYNALIGMLGESAVPEQEGLWQNASRSQARSDWADFLTRDRPAFLSLIFGVFMVLFPVLGVFLVFNQISQDTRRKGFRYVLLRTTRASLYAGKFLGAVAVLIPVIVLIVAAVAGFTIFGLDLYPPLAVVTWSLWASLAIILVTVPIVALYLFFSAFINSGFGCLAASVGVMVGFQLFTATLKSLWRPLGFIEYLLPLRAGFYLFHPEWWAVILAAVGCLLYTAVYLGGGYLYFKRKSL